VAPGAVLLPPGMDPEQLAKRIPLQRIGTPEDVVRTVLFLAQAPFVTGEVVFVDGGRSLNP
jgi:pteridine reductase